MVNCKFIKDAYAEIMLAFEEGKFDIVPYEAWTEKQKEDICRFVKTEYHDPDLHANYQYFGNINSLG